jgi:hypothetical protein
MCLSCELLRDTPFSVNTAASEGLCVTSASGGYVCLYVLSVWVTPGSVFCQSGLCQALACVSLGYASLWLVSVSVRNDQVQGTLGAARFFEVFIRQAPNL